MIPYASAMGAGRNRDALAAAGWRLLLNPLDPRDPGEFAYCLDNGAWGAFQASRPWDEDAFERALDRYGASADFVVLPDIVAGGLESLALSMRWSNRCLGSCRQVLIAVQDGMEPADIEPFVGPQVGVFLGGSTGWKLARMQDWGAFCAARGLWYHVARVNTQRRFKLAHLSGATSIDGSSASKFADSLPKVDAWRRETPPQRDLWEPAR